MRRTGVAPCPAADAANSPSQTRWPIGLEVDRPAARSASTVAHLQRRSADGFQYETAWGLSRQNSSS
jgi:hypothetical protein